MVAQILELHSIIITDNTRLHTRPTYQKMLIDAALLSLLSGPCVGSKGIWKGSSAMARLPWKWRSAVRRGVERLARVLLEHRAALPVVMWATQTERMTR